MPFGIDALLILLASGHREIFWVFPPLVTVASLVGAAVTYWIGRSAGDAGLSRLVSVHRLDQMKLRLRKAGYGSVAAAAVLPPPFPLTPFILACGALELDRARFFLVFGVMRLVRYGTVALLAREYGARLLPALESDVVRTGVVMTVVAAFAVTIIWAVIVWRRTRPQLAPSI